jgi:hypothetical protein
MTLYYKKSPGTLNIAATNAFQAEIDASPTRLNEPMKDRTGILCAQYTPHWVYWIQYPVCVVYIIWHTGRRFCGEEVEIVDTRKNSIDEKCQRSDTSNEKLHTVSVSSGDIGFLVEVYDQGEGATQRTSIISALFLLLH